MLDKWTDKCLLNIDKIDQQHKAFFNLWNTEMEQVDTQDRIQMTQVIEKLEDYIKAHFREEEELMEKSGYNDIEKHIDQHKYLIQKVDDLKQEINYNNPLIYEKTAVFMKKWFLNHIIQTDKKYQETVLEYLKNK